MCINDTVKDISLEILWKSNSVSNQQFKANIDIYIIVRAIDKTKNLVDELIASVFEICKLTLNSQKYHISDVGENEFNNVITSIKDNKITALVKEEKIENLQNQLLPYCYCYDRFPISNKDLSRIVNALIEHPDCAISMQLIPSQLNKAE